MARYLYIEDDENFGSSSLKLARKRCPDDEFVHVINFQDAVANLTTPPPFNGIICDWNFPGAEDPAGRAFLKHAREHAPDIPFTYLSAQLPQTIQKALQESGIDLPIEHIFRKPDFLPKIVQFLKEKYGSGVRPGGRGPGSEPPPNALKQGS